MRALRPAPTKRSVVLRGTESARQQPSVWSPTGSVTETTTVETTVIRICCPVPRENVLLTASAVHQTTDVSQPHGFATEIRIVTMLVTSPKRLVTVTRRLALETCSPV